jgi:hypothetical protein
MRTTFEKRFFILKKDKKWIQTISLRYLCSGGNPINHPDPNAAGSCLQGE